jgi:dihydroxyacetone kinase-like predicted kinase
MGTSLQVVGDEQLVRVLVHTHNTQAILDYSATHGTLSDINIEQQDEQVKRFKMSNTFNIDKTEQP